jgi:hypothetical protein
MNDAQIRERLAKIIALFAGATTDGERNAAEAALARIELNLPALKDQDSQFIGPLTRRLPGLKPQFLRPEY